METNNVTYKYFKPEEFAKCIPACCIEDMQTYFLAMLDKAREKAGVPFILNSAFRSYAHEIKMGRSGNSSHCLGVAVDIACSSSRYRLDILKALLDTGFKRIGIYSTFIHVDFDMSKPECIWYGK